MRGPLKKFHMAPCRTSFPVPTLGYACTGHPAARQLKHRRKITRLPCNQIDEEPKITPIKKAAHRGFGCTPRVAGNRGELTTRNTVSPHVGCGGTHKASLGDVGNGSRVEARQGAIRIFSGNPIVFRSAPQPAIPASPDARSREPSSRTITAGTPAFSRSETLQDRASGVRGGHCVRTIRPTRRSTPDVQPETGKRSAGLGNTAERRLNSVGAPSLGSRATKSTKSQKSRGRPKAASRRTSPEL